jgi:hypothetical protein
LIDEMADQVIADIAQEAGGFHGVCQVLESVPLWMEVEDVVDEVVQSDGVVYHASRLS